VTAASAWREDYGSWGRAVSARHRVVRPESGAAAARALAAADGGLALAYGCGRSYGDVALNPDGLLLDCRGLDRFVSFDRETGLLACEAGVRLADILAVACRPEPDGGGWFLPVSPGTRFVTVGGAIANDVHGKNHHRAGTFGRHVHSLELLRSDGSRRVCSPAEDAALFAATIGGLGLTGVVLRATVKLRRVEGLALEAEDIRFGTLDEFFALAEESDRDWEYTAAWVDCLAGGRGLGRGIYSRARHAPGVPAAPPDREPRLAVPATPPVSLVGRWSVRGFNGLYWRRLGTRGRRRWVGSYAPILYPLDAIGGWNRLYGPRGFHQFQCAVPPDGARAAMAEMLEAIAASGEGSMLTVLKRFGDLPSPGLLSFPMPGATLALDFPERGEGTRRLLARLERIVVAARGRLYPAKDSAMSAAALRAGYPALERFLPFVDPGLSSAFARRVGLLAGGGGDQP
jgi:FAD/FMN-containing dehydrogenase